MKKIYKAFRKSLAISAGLVVLGSSAIAQDDVAVFLKAGVDDANKLIEAYMSPFGNAFGTYMNSGWYNTAKAHKPGGFDLTLTVNAVQVPTKFQSYDFTSLGTSKLKYVSGSKEGPTIFGSNQQGGEVGVFMPNPLYGVNPGSSQDTAITSFGLPPGIGVAMLPLPNLQLRVGIYKNTDIMFRYIPSLSIPGGTINGKIGSWGVGLMHDFKQWIPGFKEAPFDMAIQGAYSKFHFGVDFPNTLLPEPGTIYADGTPTSSSGYGDQGFDYDMSAWNANVLISKKLSVLTLYAGLGFAASNGSIKMGGSYPIPAGVDTTVANLGKTIVTDIKDPINFKMSSSSPRFTAGFRLKMLWIMTLHAEYTLAKYPVITAGFGFTIR